MKSVALQGSWLLWQLCSFWPSQAAGWTVGQTVKTSSGNIIGHGASNFTNVSEYLGIPYAQPPTGSLRFQAPVAYTSTATLNASSFSLDCSCNVAPVSVANAGISNLAGPQAVSLIDNISQYGHSTSEDCLKLNIWTAPQNGDTKKAVMVWIYGGGFQTGTTNTYLYNGQVLAATTDVVVVTLNYRANVFGFPGLPGSGFPQNPGLLDQRLAIEWIRSNIAGFGGDPSRIVLFGQSAGAAAIDMYTYAWTSDPIISGIIGESGVATSFVNPTPPNNTAAWYTLSAQLGCGSSSTPLSQSIACMQGLSAQQILAGEASTRLQFNPSVDDITVFSDYDTLTQEGKFIKVPVLMGNNDYEAGIIKVLYQEQGITQSLQDWAILNLEDFTCPVGHRAQGKASQVPLWRYRYFGEFPNTQLTNNPDSGAWHGSEIPIVFGTATGTGVSDTAYELAETVYIVGAWTTFAKNPWSGLKSQPFNWPTYNQNSQSLIRLAYPQQFTASYIYPVTYDYACAAVLAPGGPNMTALGQVANLTQLGGGSQIGY